MLACRKEAGKQSRKPARHTLAPRAAMFPGADEDVAARNNRSFAISVVSGFIVSWPARPKSAQAEGAASALVAGGLRARRTGLSATRSAQECRHVAGTQSGLCCEPLRPTAAPRELEGPCWRSFQTTPERAPTRHCCPPMVSIRLVVNVRVSCHPQTGAALWVFTDGMALGVAQDDSVSAAVRTGPGRSSRERQRLLACGCNCVRVCVLARALVFAWLLRFAAPWVASSPWPA